MEYQNSINGGRCKGFYNSLTVFMLKATLGGREEGVNGRGIFEAG